MICAAVIAAVMSVGNPGQELIDAAGVELGLRRVEVGVVTIHSAGHGPRAGAGHSVAGGISADVTIDGRPRTLELAPHSSRADGYRLRMQIEDGSWLEVEAGPARTVRGTVAGVPGSAVAGSWLDDGLYAIVRMPGGRRFWVEPVGLRIGADPRLHAVYDEADVIPTGSSCAADTAHMGANTRIRPVRRGRKTAAIRDRAKLVRGT